MHKHHTKCLLKIRVPDSFPRESDSVGLCGAEESAFLAFALIKISWMVQNSKVINWDIVKNNCPFYAWSPPTLFILLDITLYFLYWSYALAIDAYTSIYKYMFLFFFTYAVAYCTHCFAFCAFPLGYLDSSLFNWCPVEENLFLIFCYLSNTASISPHLCYFTHTYGMSF